MFVELRMRVLIVQPSSGHMQSNTEKIYFESIWKGVVGDGFFRRLEMQNVELHSALLTDFRYTRIKLRAVGDNLCIASVYFLEILRSFISITHLFPVPESSTAKAGPFLPQHYWEVHYEGLII